MESTRTVDKYGTICYKNERRDLHREDGPAIEGTNGYKEWRINGNLHREDGPARIYSDGDERYYLNDKRYSKKQWETEVVKLKLGRILDL